MRIVLFTLLVFCFAVAVSSAIPLDIDESRSIKRPTLNDLNTSLSRRKPPGKIPGPRLLIQNPMGEGEGDFTEGEPKYKSLVDEGKENKKKKTIHLANEKKDRMSSLNKEEKEKGNGKGKGKGKDKDLIQPENHKGEE